MDTKKPIVADQLSFGAMVQLTLFICAIAMIPVGFFLLPPILKEMKRMNNEIRVLQEQVQTLTNQK